MALLLRLRLLFRIARWIVTAAVFLFATISLHEPEGRSRQPDYRPAPGVASLAVDGDSPDSGENGEVRIENVVTLTADGRPLESLVRVEINGKGYETSLVFESEP